MAHEINPLRLLLGSYSFSASSTRNGGRNDSPILVQRPTESLSNISNLHRVRVCGRLQFPDESTQTKGWKIFQDYRCCFHFVCTSNCPLRHSSLGTLGVTQWLRPLQLQWCHIIFNFRYFMRFWKTTSWLYLGTCGFSFLSSSCLSNNSIGLRCRYSNG